MNVYLIERKRKWQRKDGSITEIMGYWLRWLGSDGKWQHESLGRTKRSGGTLTKRAAKTARAEKEASLNRNEIPRDKPREMTLQAFIDWHQDAERFGRRASTIDAWRTAGKHLRAALGDETRLTSLTPAHIGKVQTHLEDGGKSPATIRKTLATLRGMFNNAKRHGLIHANPLDGKKLGPPPRREKRIFSPAEIEALVTAAPDLWWQSVGV